MGVHLTRVAPVTATVWWVESTHPLAHACNVFIVLCPTCHSARGAPVCKIECARPSSARPGHVLGDRAGEAEPCPGGAQRGDSPKPTVPGRRERSWTGRAEAEGYKGGLANPTRGHSGRRCFGAEACESWLGGTQKTRVKTPPMGGTSPQVRGEGASVVTAWEVAASQSRPGSWDFGSKQGFAWRSHQRGDLLASSPASWWGCRSETSRRVMWLLQSSETELGCQQLWGEVLRRRTSGCGHSRGQQD